MKPHTIATEPQDLAESSGTPPRRIVTPLAPTAAPVERPSPFPVATPPPPDAGLPGPGSHSPRVQRIIIGAGWVFYAGLLALLFWPRE